MAQILLWLEAATASVLFLALGIALAARVRGEHRRGVLLGLWTIATVLPWLLVIAGLGSLQYGVGGARWPLTLASGSAALALVAGVLVVRRARHRLPGSSAAAAAGWSLRRLTLAWAAALLLTCVTFWNIDLAVRQEMATLRVEAGAIAMSVAPPRVPEPLNAAPLYLEACERLDAAEREERPLWRDALRDWLEPPAPHGSRERPPFDPDDPELRAFLERHQPVLALLHEASRRPACVFGIDYYPLSPSLHLPGMWQLRSLGAILCLSARVHAHDGRRQEAMRDLSAAFAMAAHATDEPPLLALSVACATEDRAFEALAYVLAQAEPAAADLDVLDLRKALSFFDAYHRAMRLDTAYRMAIFSWPSIEPYAAFIDHRETDAVTLAGVMDGAAYRVLLWRQEMTAFLQWQAWWEQLSARPYHEHARDWRDPHPAAPVPRGVRMLALGHGPVQLQSFATRAATADAQHRLARLAVAMWRYRLEHGAFPDGLDALAPQYLPTIPIDPFTGDSVKLTRADGRLVIYSVGENLTDDGGTSVDGYGQPDDIVLPLEPRP